MKKLKKILMLLALFSSLKASEYNEAAIQKGMAFLGLNNMDEVMIEFLKTTELKVVTQRIAENKDWFDREQIKILLGMDEKTLNDRLYSFLLSPERLKVHEEKMKDPKAVHDFAMSLKGLASNNPALDAFNSKEDKIKALEAALKNAPNFDSKRKIEAQLKALKIGR